jgi:DNA polymerase V
MSLDEYLIKNKEAIYILKVKGDSMIGAGIRAGDLVIIERTNRSNETNVLKPQQRFDETAEFTAVM